MPESGTKLKPANGCIFEGEKELFYVNRDVVRVWPDEIFEEPIKGTDIRLHADWLESIKTRKPPICDVAIGHRSATVCHLGNISIRAGRKIKWDPAKEQMVGDAEAAKMVGYAYRAP